jgi:hypothetical protein
MASGLSATTRFVGLLVGVAALGAVLSLGVNRRFVASDAVRDLDPSLVASAARRVASGDLNSVIDILGGSAQAGIRNAASIAFAGGFADASLVASLIALISCVLTFGLVRAADTAPVTKGGNPELVPAME